MSQLDPAVLKLRVQRLKSVPTLPKLMERISAALEDPDIDFARVGELIEVDQALTAQVLRLANSAFFSQQGRVGHVAQALIMLGAVVTRSVVLSSSVLEFRRVKVKGFWEHSLGCAVAAGAIAKVLGRCAPEEVTAAGLLHDLGKVVVYKEMPDAFEQLVSYAHRDRRPFRDVEREFLGADHAEIAGWLVERWRLPASLREPIRFHHAPAMAQIAKDETAIVHVANVLVRALGYGSGGDLLVPPVDARAWERLELTADRLDAVLDTFERDLDHALNYALFD